MKPRLNCAPASPCSAAFFRVSSSPAACTEPASHIKHISKDLNMAGFYTFIRRGTERIPCRVQQAKP